MATHSIALRDRKGNVVALAVVSNCDYDRVSSYRWHRVKGRRTFYASAKVEGKETRMHQLLMGKAPEGHVIDHANINGLDNTRPNLRFLTRPQNAQNTADRPRRSKYRGVSWSKIGQKWGARCGKHNFGFFHDEERAGRAYDRGALSLYGAQAKVNGLLTGEEVEHVLAHPEDNGRVKRKQRGLPLGVTLRKGEKTYLAKLSYNKQLIIIGRFQTVEAASEAVTAKKKELRDAEMAAHYALPVQRNAEGVAIIPIRNAAKEVVEYALVSDGDWHRFMLTAWSFSDGYPVGNFEGKSGPMHRLVLPDSDMVDHINHVRHDNRRPNLRTTDYSGNGQNKPKREGCASKYIGVEAHGQYWCATIQKDHKKCFLGSFLTEEEAARAYNKRAKELYDRPMLNDVANAPEAATVSATLEGPGMRKRIGATSQYLGVSRSHTKWAVEIMVDSKKVRIGRFAEELDAARAYNAAVTKYGLEKRLNNVQCAPECPQTLPS